MLGVVGLDNIGDKVSRIALAFGMKIIAWNQNMTPEIAEAAGARLVSRDELFRQADIVTIESLSLHRQPSHSASYIQLAADVLEKRYARRATVLHAIFLPDSRAVVCGFGSP
jgi:lactate dehydrogenase-like 2-hydroxyacid dehydrogenase